MIPIKKHEAAVMTGKAVQASIALTAEMFELLYAGIYENRP